MTDEFHKQFSLEGDALLFALNSLTQIAKIHSDNNDLLQDSVKNFIRVVQTLMEDEEKVSLQIQNGRFYIQENRITIRKANANLINHILRFLENRGIAAIYFYPELNKIRFNNIIAFARLLDRAVHDEDPFGWLLTQLDDRQIKWVSVENSISKQLESQASTPQTHQTDFKAQADKKKKVRRSYSHVLGAIKNVAQKLSRDQNVGMRQSIRLVQKMVDMISEDESLFLAISTIRIYDDYTFVHSLNVAILSMCMGKRIGLTHDALEILGLCGLFHDLGKVVLPKDIVNKPGELSTEEYIKLKNHSMHSSRLILKLKAERNRKIRMLVPPFEHHMGYDHSGYPTVGKERKLSLFGRILTIADVYDAITSPRIYRPDTMSPDKALGEMMSRSGTQFDPVLLKIFVNMMGLYPVGTLLKLDTGETALVMHGTDGDRTRPMVQLLIRKDGQKFEKGEIVDLGEKHLQSNGFKRNIVQALHPSAMGIQPAEFLV